MCNSGCFLFFFWLNQLFAVRRSRVHSKKVILTKKQFSFLSCVFVCVCEDEENELLHQESEVKLQQKRKQDEYHSWCGEKVQFDENFTE